jgi:uncharacterized repeat protein (TIGR03843 family)
MATAADPDALTLLAHGRIEVQGRLMAASNATLYASITLDGVERACVYKPVSGERRLWDFPDGTLAGREVSAYLLSEATGWSLVPPTVHRDGPFGPGSVQLWVEQESDEQGAGVIDVVRRDRVPDGWLRVLDAEDGAGQPVSLVHADHPDLARMAALDVVLNNADRKGGHVLDDGAGGLVGVDHGLTFNVDEKLRTVLWGWAGEPIDVEAVDVLTRVSRDLETWLTSDDETLWPEALAPYLQVDEIAVTARRARLLARRCRYPRMADGWPAIPWPPF